MAPLLKSANLSKLKSNRSRTIGGLQSHVLGVLDGLSNGGAGLPRGLPICDDDDQDGLLQDALLDAVEQEWLDDLLIQVGAQWSHAVELHLHGHPTIMETPTTPQP